MTEKDVITLCISGIALIVAVYGIFERGVATRRALRIRLTELIDELAQIDGDQQVYEQDDTKSEPMKVALRDGNATRRALLAAQAVDILAKYKRRITIPEYSILAAALRGTSNTAGQRDILEQSIAKMEGETPFQQASAWRGWAWFNFEHGRLDTARKAVRRSLDVRPTVDDVVRNEAAVTLLGWFEYEFQKSPTEHVHWGRILDEADAVAKAINNEGWRSDVTRKVAQARARTRGERQPALPTEASTSVPPALSHD